MPETTQPEDNLPGAAAAMQPDPQRQLSPAEAALAAATHEQLMRQQCNLPSPAELAPASAAAQGLEQAHAPLPRGLSAMLSPATVEALGCASLLQPPSSNPGPELQIRELNVPPLVVCLPEIALAKTHSVHDSRNVQDMQLFVQLAAGNV